MEKKVLIAYYSHSGNTQSAAMEIREQTGGTPHRILPETDYPDDYGAVVVQARKELEAGYIPPLCSEPESLEDYDTVFVGTPNWCGTMAPPVAAFLAQNELSGKKVAPFCTHGGGGLAAIGRDVAKLCPHSTVLESLALYDDDRGKHKGQVAAWLKKTGLG